MASILVKTFNQIKNFIQCRKNKVKDELIVMKNKRMYKILTSGTKIQ